MRQRHFLQLQRTGPLLREVVLPWRERLCKGDAHDGPLPREVVDR